MPFGHDLVQKWDSHQFFVANVFIPFERKNLLIHLCMALTYMYAPPSCYLNISADYLHLNRSNTNKANV